MEKTPWKHRPCNEPAPTLDDPCPICGMSAEDALDAAFADALEERGEPKPGDLS